MNNLLIKKETNIENMIYEIRGKQVMLDFDLAKLYECSNGTKSINLAVKRNKNRFPNDFYFQLTSEECLRFQFETSNNTSNNRGGRRYKVYAFTEQGVAMLSSVLHTEVAEEVSVNIMRAFVRMIKYISSELSSINIINSKLLEHDKRLSLMEETFSKFKESSNEIFYNGQIYDAYSKIVDIMNMAKEELIIIDAYADKSLLDMISKIKCKVILICKKKSLLTNLDINKYNKQYSNLKVIYNNTFHDRYFILDKKIVYHCGASINHIGEKTFSINKLEDEEIIFSLVNMVNKMGEVYE